MNSRDIGRQGELRAAGLLAAKGYEILEFNYTAREGEIDIVCRDGETCVFVEVKLRRSGRYGRAAEAVDARKRGRICQAALQYLSQNELLDCAARFDVVEINGGEANHIISAFDYQ